MQFDDELRRALRAEDPGAAFTQRVLARAREERAGREAGAPHPSQAAGATGVLRAASPKATPPNAAWPSTAPPNAAPVSAASLNPASLNPASVNAASQSTSSLSAARPRVRAARWIAAAVAASVALTAAGVQWERHRRYVAEGERARAQVLAALRITSAKLNLVHDKLTGSTEAR